jgi:L-threonylcarbamoyladenylate synthase
MDKAIQLLQAGELVVIPTETVYGLAANALNASAVEKIYALKQRPATNPLICHVASIEAMLLYIAPTAKAEIEPLLQKLAPFWPGPLTVVVPKADTIPAIISAGQPSVALRIPNHPLTLSLLSQLNFPLAAPSANRSNYVSPTKPEHVRHEFKSECPYLLDGGSCTVGLESTVLSLIDPGHPIILRPGAITQAQLTQALGIPVAVTKQELSPQTPHQSPGQGTLHYSPKTPLQLLSTFQFETSPYTRIGLIAFSADTGAEYDFAAVEVLSENQNQRMIAARLYDALRSLDAMNLDLILIDSCEPVGIGAAIMDRIQRALTKK